MRTTILSLLLLIPTLLLAFAKDPQPPQKSKIQKVTVYLEGATIARSAPVNVVNGVNEILFKTFHQILCKAASSSLDWATRPCFP